MTEETKLIRFIRQFIETVAPSAPAIREETRQYAKDHPGFDRDKLADKWANRIVWLYTGEGAVTALPGVIPGPGTGTQIAIEVGAIGADLAYMVRCMAGMTMGIAYIYEKEIDAGGFNEEFLKVLAAWCGVLTPLRGIATRTGARVVEVNIRKRLSAEVLKRINKKVGTTIVTKYGTKRGGIALGRVVPLGVGVVIGGSFNHVVMKGFKKLAINYFRGDEEAWGMKT